MSSQPDYVPPSGKTAATWEGRLQSAADVAGVLAITREFLASFTPEVLDSLPKRCQPPLKLVDVDDINSYAFDLVQHNCGDSEDGELLRILATFFSDASTRISKLLTYRQRQIAARLSR